MAEIAEDTVNARPGYCIRIDSKGIVDRRAGNVAGCTVTVRVGIIGSEAFAAAGFTIDSGAIVNRQKIRIRC
ncbi:hypothetical protein ES708_14278 [subsurface metagenome]